MVYEQSDLWWFWWYPSTKGYIGFARPVAHGFLVSPCSLVPGCGRSTDTVDTTRPKNTSLSRHWHGADMQVLHALGPDRLIGRWSRSMRRHFSMVQLDHLHSRSESNNHSSNNSESCNVLTLAPFVPSYSCGILWKHDLPILINHHIPSLIVMNQLQYLQSSWPRGRSGRWTAVSHWSLRTSHIGSNPPARPRIPRRHSARSFNWLDHWLWSDY